MKLKEHLRAAASKYRYIMCWHVCFLTFCLESESLPLKLQGLDYIRSVCTRPHLYTHIHQLQETTLLPTCFLVPLSWYMVHWSTPRFCPYPNKVTENHTIFCNVNIIQWNKKTSSSKAISLKLPSGDQKHILDITNNHHQSLAPKEKQHLDSS